MSYQVNFSNNRYKHSSSYKPSFQERKCGTEKFVLLKAPSVESAVLWKRQAFQAAIERLRPKLKDCTADALIAVFAEHFPLSTHAAEQEARRAVQAFQNEFSNVDNLEPTGFVDIRGDNQTKNMYRPTRPPNVCHLGVQAAIQMRKISDAFTMDDSYVLEYYLRLPQSFTPSTQSLKRKSRLDSSSIPSTDIDSAMTLDNSIFTPTSKVLKKQRLFQSILEPGIKASTPPGSETRRLFPADISVHTQPDADKNNANATSKDNEEANSIPTQGNDSNSNSSFDYAKQFQLAPKAANLILQHKSSANNGLGTVHTYHDSLGVLDEQATFSATIPHWMEMYELSTGANGKPSEKDSTKLQTRLKKVYDTIQFRVFQYEFRRAYVGTEESDDVCEKVATAHCQKQLQRIKMVYRDPNTNSIIETTPDTVFKKMMNFVSLLPTQAQNWGFCLPWLFFQSLPSDLRNEITESDSYSLPAPATLPTKSLQISSMTEIRDVAKRVYEKTTELRKTVERYTSFMTSNRSEGRATLCHYSIDDDTAQDTGLMFEDDKQPARDEVYHTQEVPVYQYSQVSRAEQTFRMEHDKKRELEGCPPNFQMKYHTENGTNFPSHPSGDGRYSNYPVGFFGCFACGSTNHRYRDCRDRSSVEGRQRFTFNLHCHKPSLFFKRRQFEPHNTSSRGSPYGPPHSQRYEEERRSTRPTDESTASSRYPRSGERGSAEINRPAWMNRNSSYTAYRRTGDNSKSTFVVNFRSHNVSETKTRRMPIDSINELPHVNFPIGLAEGVAAVSSLFDTGAALNTGYLPYHRFIMSTRPDLIAEYEEFNGRNPFDPIKLGGAITDPSAYNLENHGLLKAVIRYHTPFKTGQDAKPLFLSFALGNDITVNSIIGLPFINALELAYHHRPNIHVSSDILERTFSITFKETTKTHGKEPLDNDDAQPPRKQVRIATMETRVTADLDTAIPPSIHSAFMQKLAEDSSIPINATEQSFQQVSLDDNPPRTME